MISRYFVVISIVVAGCILVGFMVYTKLSIHDSQIAWQELLTPEYTPSSETEAYYHNKSISATLSTISTSFYHALPIPTESATNALITRARRAVRRSREQVTSVVLPTDTQELVPEVLPTITEMNIIPEAVEEVWNRVEEDIEITLDPQHALYEKGKALWPFIYGKSGPYSISKPTTEFDDVGAAGFTLIEGGYIPPTSPLYIELTTNNLTYLDNYFWNVVYPICHAKKVANPTSTCILSATETQTILTKVKAHLVAVAQDPTIVGFWILDDYPGDIHEVLEQIHAAVVEANKTSIFPRATVCGFGGSLDTKKNISDNTFTPSSLDVDTLVDTSLVNITPTACDIISPYSYARMNINNPDLVDWSMTSLLPRYFSMLSAHGWDQSSQPLLPLVHTFGYSIGTTSSPLYWVTPRQADVKAQVEAYCKVGAIGMMAYAWDDGFTGTKKELYNSPEMIAGMKEGIGNCGWGVGSTILVPADPNMPSGAISVTARGVVPDDGLDDTAAIQTIIDSAQTGATIYFPAGTYDINPIAQTLPVKHGIHTKSNLTIVLAPEAVLQAMPVTVGNYAVIGIYSQNTVSISGGSIRGERAQHSPADPTKPGEWGFGIDIRSADSVTIKNMRISDCWGDGIYVGVRAAIPKSLVFDTLTFDNNRRNGLSIVAGDGIVVSNSHFENTQGTNPQNGLDIEPNTVATPVSNVLIKDSFFVNNAHEGITVTAARGGISDVTIQDSTFSGNQTYGVRLGYGLTNITVKNSTFDTSGTSHLVLYGTGISVSEVHLQNNTYSGDVPVLTQGSNVIIP